MEVRIHIHRDAESARRWGPGEVAGGADWAGGGAAPLRNKLGLMICCVEVVGPAGGDEE